MSLMTLDEAIQHCRDKENCSQCGQEHKRLREWLEELKELRSQYNLPKPHGRLIDADEIRTSIESMKAIESAMPVHTQQQIFDLIINLISNVATVIEAEE